MKTAVVILAAGEGTRMKSGLPKVLHRICGQTMLGAVVQSVRRMRPEWIVVVAGRHLGRIRDEVGSDGLTYALQEEPLGTGHAVVSALSSLEGFSGDLVVLNGDSPLVTAGTLRKFLRLHRQKKNDLSVLSFIAGNPEAYGRVVRQQNGALEAIVEEKDADRFQKEITEVNSGVYVLGPGAVGLLGAIRVNPLKKEYYLTDIVSLSARKGLRSSAFCIGREEEFMGINTRDELRRATCIMSRDIIAGLTGKGVEFVDPETVYIDRAVRIGSGTVIYPNVCLQGETSVGREAVIYPNVRVADSRIGSRAVIKDSTVIEKSEVGEAAAVGPFAHLRPGSVVGPDARIGNFVELKKTVIGRGSKASHLSYLGDAAIGKDVNIGAGTITCNYDGFHKHLTVIEDGVFIGSDSQLMAPVRIGRGAYVGAGSTITRDVPGEALALSRVAQQHVPGWARKRKSKKK